MDTIAQTVHTIDFVTPVLGHRLEQEIAQSMGLLHNEPTLYHVSLPFQLNTDVKKYCILPFNFDLVWCL